MVCGLEEFYDVEAVGDLAAELGHAEEGSVAGEYVVWMAV